MAHLLDVASIALEHGADEAIAALLHDARAILADVLTFGESVWDRFNGGKSDALWYYRALVGAFRAVGSPTPLINELDRGVTEIERLAG